MRANPPLNGRYWVTVALVLLALVPDLVISTASALTRQVVVRDLHTTVARLALGDTFSNAGWAFGAVLAAYLFQRFGPRHPLLVYQAGFVAGSLVAAAAPNVWFVVAGHILQGLFTGMLLVAALPPLITGYPVARIGTTATVVGLGLFGAVMAGPLVGGYVAATGSWHGLFAAAALLGVVGFALDALSVAAQAPANAQARPDMVALALTAAGAALTFWGVAEVAAHSWQDPIVWGATALGVLAIVAVIGYEYHAHEPLMPVRPLATTFPVIGITAGIVAGLVFTALLEIVFLLLEHVRGLGPLSVGLLMWPGLLTAVAASVLFGKLFTTRYVLVLPLSGLLALLVAAWLLTTTTIHTPANAMLWISGLLGAGAGLTVSPGLFIGGLSVPPKLVGRAFALVEMLRLAGAFAFLPAFLTFATVYGMSPANLIRGMHVVYWVLLSITGATIAFTAALFFLGGARLHAPDLAAYLEHGREAFELPPVGAGGAHPAALREAVTQGLRSALAGEPKDEPSEDDTPEDRVAEDESHSGREAPRPRDPEERRPQPTGPAGR